MKKKDFTVFQITEPNTGGTIEEMRFPPSRTIQPLQEVLDEKGERRLIRYIPTEKSIYVDEQKTPFSWDDYKIGKGVRLQKPEFVDGYMIVNHSQKRLLEFMKAAKNNIVNAKNNDVRSWTYFEIDLEAENKEELEVLERFAGIQEKIFHMTKEDAMSLIVLYGVPVETAREETLNSMRMFLIRKAEEDMDKFESFLTDDMNNYKFEVIEAMNLGILVKQGNIIKWEDGNRASTAPEGQDPIAILAEKMLVDKNLTDAIRRRIKIRKGGYDSIKSQEEIIETSVDVLEGLTKDELVDKIIEMNKEGHKLFDRKGAVFHLNEQQLKLEDSEHRGGYDAAREYLLDPEGIDAFEQLKAKLILTLNG